MSVLPIYLYGSEVLRKKAAPVKNVDDSLIKLIIDMFETMRKAEGIGLAANQVGKLDRVLVLDVSEIEDLKDVKPMALINPEIVEGTGEWAMEEGCLSIPDVRGEVTRTERIKVRFRNSKFENEELEAAGLLARVILHEIDHLDGILFLDHVDKADMKEHKDQLREIQKGLADVSYPVVVAADANATHKK